MPDHIIRDLASLEALYGEVNEQSSLKEISYLHPYYAAFIKASPFAVLATAGASGLDASPRGDPPGFVEIADNGRWTLPGGWCDILESPRQAIEREVQEEAGLPVRAIHLAGVLDRHHWPHVPVYDRHIYKLFFVCEPLAELDTTFTSSETSARPIPEPSCVRARVPSMR